MRCHDGLGTRWECTVGHARIKEVEAVFLAVSRACRAGAVLRAGRRVAHTCKSRRGVKNPAVTVGGPLLPARSLPVSSGPPVCARRTLHTAAQPAAQIQISLSAERLEQPNQKSPMSHKKRRSCTAAVEPQCHKRIKSFSQQKKLKDSAARRGFEVPERRGSGRLHTRYAG
jgi:hypothetical protein